MLQRILRMSARRIRRLDAAWAARSSVRDCSARASARGINSSDEADLLAINADWPHQATSGRVFIRPIREPSVNRRQLLRIIAASATMAALPACTSLPARHTPRAPTSRSLVPVRVAPELVIRTVAGLRPFRPTGFRLETERFGDTHVVHNYGHGGGGWSLSWGCSQLALEEVVAITGGSQARDVAVLGCGILGLTSATLLQRAGYRVTIYAQQLPPHTASNIAGALWTPVSVHDDDEAVPGYRARFERASRIAYRHFQEQVGTRYGVRWIDNYFESPGPEVGAPNDIVRQLPELFPQQRLLGPGEHPFVHPWMWHHATMFMEPHVYLPEIERDLRIAGVGIVVRTFRSVDEVRSLPECVVVNCTGLGAGALFGDPGILPIRGQLAFLRPQPAVDYIVIQGGRYMFPRSDGILLGGTFERDEWEASPQRVVTDRIVADHAAFFAAMAPVGR